MKYVLILRRSVLVALAAKGQKRLNAPRICPWVHTCNSNIEVTYPKITIFLPHHRFIFQK